MGRSHDRVFFFGGGSEDDAHGTRGGAAWSRRWFQMAKGVLSYYKSPGAYCRGTIDMASATVTVVLRTRQIVVDNGTLLFHLRGASAWWQTT